MTLSDAVRSSLEGLSSYYEILECDPRYADTAAFCDHYGYPPSNSANTIIVASRRGPQRYGACLVAADTRLDVNRKVRQELAVPKLSFARADETEELTGMELGGVTVFGLPSDIPLLIEETLLDLDYVILGAGTRSAKIKAPPSILRGLPGARVVTALAVPG